LCVFDVAVCVTAIGRKLGVKRKDLRQIAPVANAAPAIVVAMVTSSAVRSLIAPAHSIIILGACAIIFTLIYLVAALLFGAWTPEDQEAIYKHARRLSRKFRSVEAPKPTRIEDRGSRIEDRVIASKAIFDPHPSILDPPLFTPECKARAVLQLLQCEES